MWTKTILNILSLVFKIQLDHACFHIGEDSATNFDVSNNTLHLQYRNTISFTALDRKSVV